MEPGGKDLVCRICGVEVESDLEMIRHIREQHPEDVNFRPGKKIDEVMNSVVRSRVDQQFSK